MVVSGGIMFSVVASLVGIGLWSGAREESRKREQMATTIQDKRLEIASKLARSFVRLEETRTRIMKVNNVYVTQLTGYRVDRVRLAIDQISQKLPVILRQWTLVQTKAVLKQAPIENEYDQVLKELGVIKQELDDLEYQLKLVGS